MMETKPLLSSTDDGATSSPHHRQMNHPEQRSYNSPPATKELATNNRQGLIESSSSTTSGRGKLRFNMRQQLKQQKILQQQSKPVDIYNAIFPSKRNINVPHHIIIMPAAKRMTLTQNEAKAISKEVVL